MSLTQLLRWNIGAVTVMLVLTIAAGGAATAQDLYGSVVGSVQDGSGARIPGATIEIVNRATNLVLTAVSNESGAYTLTNVLPGTYDVRVALQGFKEFKQSQIPVSAGSISRVDARLEVGALTESVTVKSEAVLLKTDKADTASAFTDKEVVDLPLPEFRNYQSLLDFVPGSTPSDFQNAEIDTPARALTTNINGTNRNTNSTRVDGATNQFTWLPHHTLYVAPAETIASVNVTTGSFSADQGLAGGAAVTVITKSGTNRLRGRGSPSTPIRTCASARISRSGTTRPSRPPTITSTAARWVGRSSGTSCSTSVPLRGSIAIQKGNPSTLCRPRRCGAGDFSEAFNTNGSLQLIYDPRTGDSDGRGRLPFTGNAIPADRINAIAQRINQFYPMPNQPGNSDNYFKEYSSTFDRNQYDVKINWNRSAGHQVWGKIGVMDATVSNLQKLAFDGGGLGKTLTWVATIGQTFTPSPTLVIDTTFGYSLLDQWGYGPDYGTNYGLELGVPGTNGPDIRQSGMPVWGNGMSAQGSTDAWNPYTRFDPTYTAIRQHHQARRRAHVPVRRSRRSAVDESLAARVRRHGPARTPRLQRQPVGACAAAPDAEFLQPIRVVPARHDVAGAEGHPVGGDDDARVEIRVLLRRPVAASPGRDARSGSPLRVLPARESRQRARRRTARRRHDGRAAWRRGRRPAQRRLENSARRTLRRA